jgi:hypothetical protein
LLAKCEEKGSNAECAKALNVFMTDPESTLLIRTCMQARDELQAGNGTGRRKQGGEQRWEADPDGHTKINPPHSAAKDCQRIGEAAALTGEVIAQGNQKIAL